MLREVETAVTSSPEWLAMAAYGLLVFLYVIGPDMSLRTLSTVAGYSLLFLSKVYASRKNKDGEVIAKTWGYLCVAAGLKFTHWRDAVAVLAYAMSLAHIDGADTLISAVLALNIRDSTHLGSIIARTGLIVYSM